MTLPDASFYVEPPTVPVGLTLAEWSRMRAHRRRPWYRRLLRLA